jgi:rRNA maturation endonuclease Nob1
MEQILNPDQIKEEFAKRKKRQYILSAPIILFLVAAMLVSKHSEIKMFGLSNGIIVGLAFALVLVFVIYTIRNWRCPACEKYLGRSISIDFCPKCGVKLK